MANIDWEERVFQLAGQIYASNIDEMDVDSAVENAIRFKERYMEIMSLDESKKEKKATKKSDAAFDVRADLSYVDEKYLPLWNEWLDYKDEIKKQYKTQRGAQMQYTSWVKYSEGSINLANAVIRRSMEQSWDGLFELSAKQKALFGGPHTPYGFIAEMETLAPKTTNNEKLIIGGLAYK